MKQISLGSGLVPIHLSLFSCMVDFDSVDIAHYAAWRKRELLI